MNIKSLLLGSAAALVAVSGARAADAVVVAEPEPVEYVRVCDVYGAGFYYIPGTETCLKVSGYIRYDIGVGDTASQLRLQTIDKQDFIDDVLDGDLTAMASTSTTSTTPIRLVQARSLPAPCRCPFGNRTRHAARLLGVERPVYDRQPRRCYRHERRILRAG